MKSCLLFFGLMLMLSGVGPVLAQVNSHSDGSDGVLRVVNSPNFVIDLSAARTDSAYAPGTGNGVYDAKQWAVVFKYDSVFVDNASIVTFKNHPSNAPVVWLVRGNVRIQPGGRVYLSGGNDAGSTISQPGPGGFHGGRGFVSPSAPGSSGFGPGGGVYDPANYGQGGSYRASNGGSLLTYGNAKILPLIGGSGGAGRHDGVSGGGAGGGALLIVSDGTTYLDGNIGAAGGYASYGGCGSGGAIRVVTNAIVGSGALYANGPGGQFVRCNGGEGRIRIEANSFAGYTGGGSPNAITQLGIEPGGAIIWPQDTAPSVRILTLGGQPVPADPQSNLTFGDVNLSAKGTVLVELECANVPLNATVVVRVVPRSGPDYTVTASAGVGTALLSTRTATLPGLPVNGLAGIQARAILP